MLFITHVDMIGRLLPYCSLFGFISTFRLIVYHSIINQFNSKGSSLTFDFEL